MIDCPLIYHTLATFLPNLYPVTKYFHAKKKVCMSFMHKLYFWPLKMNNKLFYNLMIDVQNDNNENIQSINRFI